MPSSTAHHALLRPSGSSAGAAGVPRLKFHSQVAHRADLATAGPCGLCPPAPSLQPHSTPAPPGLPEAAEAGDGGSWGEQGSFRPSQRASQLSEILKLFKEGLIPTEKCETAVRQINH